MRNSISSQQPWLSKAEARFVLLIPCRWLIDEQTIYKTLWAATALSKTKKWKEGLYAYTHTTSKLISISGDHSH